MTLHEEIREQPDVLARVLRDARDPIGAIAAQLASREIEHVVIVARGTSDHAAIYAQYVFGVRHRLPAALAAPSIVSVYDVEPRFARSLVIGISQSGASPDVVATVAAARRQGAPTIAITNTPGSDLSEAAEWTIDLRAGRERAVAATKTYTAELATIALLSVALNGDPPEDVGALATLPDRVATVLSIDGVVAAAAADLAAVGQCIVLGRGYEYATAREAALKLKEVANVLADPYSTADFQHGPISLVDGRSTVVAIAPSGRGAADVEPLLGRLHEYGADLLVLSDRDDLLAHGRHAFRLPPDVPEWLMPIVSVVPAQLLALHLARARGLDPDAPRHLAKVTATR